MNIFEISLAATRHESFDPAQADEEVDRLWLLLAERVNAIGNDISGCELALYRLGQHFTYEIFPEAAFSDIAGRVDQLGFYIRALLGRAQSLRHLPHSANRGAGAAS